MRLMAVTQTPLEQATELLQELPLLRIKLSRALFCPPNTCEPALAEVIKFLFLASQCTDTPVTPSARVDQAWHEFILFTRTYIKFCEKSYGRIIHHEPSDDHHKNSQQYSQTLRRYRECFGQPPAEFWAVNRSSAEGLDNVDQNDTQHRNAHCGNCESDSN